MIFETPMPFFFQDSEKIPTKTRLENIAVRQNALFVFISIAGEEVLMNGLCQLQELETDTREWRGT